jgi:hypothetical protein
MTLGRRSLVRLLSMALVALTAASCSVPGTEESAAPVPDPVSLTPTSAAEEACRFFPADNIWNTSILDAPVHPLSDTYVQAIGVEDPLHPDFGAGLWEGGPIGIPFAEIAPDTTAVDVTFEYADESDPGPYPIPPDVPIEGGPDSDGDRHILLLSMKDCLLYEVYAAHRNGDGSWQAGSAAIFDLRSNALRPAGWTSADAAGLPILPGLVRYDEVASGSIRHALRFTAPRIQRAYVWPARHFASEDTDTGLPPMGQRFRLRADFDLGGFSPEVRVILRALQVYGMLLADNGSPWFLSGSPDERWDNEVLRALRQVRGRDFEAVEVASWMGEADSARVRR